METSILAMVIILILFDGLSFLVLMNTLKRIAEDVEEMRIDHQQEQVNIELDKAFDSKIPMPTFFDPVTELKSGAV